MEEGGILNGQMKRLEDLYGSGIRLMTIMWNYENCIGHPASKGRFRDVAGAEALRDRGGPPDE